MPIYEIIGLIGMVITLLAYYLLQTERVGHYSLIYLGLNIFGSAFILYSLFFDWNLAAALMESAWVVISAYGILKSGALVRRQREA